MKKVMCIAVAALMSVAVSNAAETGKTDKEIGNIGVGYQGLFLNGMLNGVAVRQTPAPIGWQAEIMQGALDTDDADGWMIVLKGKGYYSLIERENSKFYVGAGLGFWYVDVDGDGITGLSFSPLMGVEWNFAGLPELGFNFEVNYEMMLFDADDVGAGDIGVAGVNVTTGIIYYF